MTRRWLASEVRLALTTRRTAALTEDKSKATRNGKHSWKHRRSGNGNRTGNSQSSEDENNEHSGPDPQCPHSHQSNCSENFHGPSVALRDVLRESGARESLGRSLSSF